MDTKEKTRIKRKINNAITKWLKANGFEKEDGYFVLKENSSKLVMLLQVPTYDTYYRAFTRWEDSSGKKMADGPESFPYECKNHPGTKRYNFNFHIKEETHQRCITNLEAWFKEILLPWFAERTTVNWRNPNVYKA